MNLSEFIRSFIQTRYPNSAPQVDLASAPHALVLATFENFRLIGKFSSSGISGAFFAGLLFVAGALGVFMDLDSLFANRNVGRPRVNPGSAVVVVHAVLLIALVHRSVGVAAKDARRLFVACVGESAVGDLFR